MRMTLDLDDELVASARELAGAQDLASLVHESLKTFIQRENGRRLARLGGSEPDLVAPPRRTPARGARHD